MSIQKHKQEIVGTIGFTHTCMWVGCEELFKYDSDNASNCSDILPNKWQYISVSKGGRINEDTGLPPASDVHGTLCTKHAKELRSLLKKMNKKTIENQK
jgi:hypothetical protein